MKNKKAFTLVELIAVITLLGVIALITVPIVNNAINNSREKALKEQENRIVNAARRYAADDPSILPDEGEKYVDLSMLREAGFLADEDIINPVTDEVIDDYCVLITFDNGKYKYEYKKCPLFLKKGNVKKVGWNDFVSAIKSDKYDNSIVGETVSYTIGGTNYKFRIVNASTPDECKSADYSQTGCGVVLEFDDLFTTYQMTKAQMYNGEQYIYGYNYGGWPASELYAKVKNMYQNLPSELKEKIVDTKVVSGYNKTYESKIYNSVDKLFILSVTEIYGPNSNTTWNEDTAKEYTHQLDYYKNKNVSATNYAGAIKYYNGTAASWWTRTPAASYTLMNQPFVLVNATGEIGNLNASNWVNLSLAFRIDE